MREQSIENTRRESIQDIIVNCEMIAPIYKGWETTDDYIINRVTGDVYNIIEG